MRGALLIAMLLAGPALADLSVGDPDKGKRVFKKCVACHQIGPEAKNKVGPQLNGILGRPMASIEGFRYSKALKAFSADDRVWDEAALNQFLIKPRSYVKGTTMSFNGLRKEKDRANLIAYFRSLAPEQTVTAELDPAILALKGDAEYGEYLSGECTTCHQTSGSDQGIPAITGLSEHDFVVFMHSYKDKTRDHPVMQMIAGRLNNEEIAALAAYFAGVDG